MTRIISVVSTQNYSHTSVAKLSMRTFAAGHKLKTGRSQVRDELPDFARHTSMSIKASIRFQRFNRDRC